MNNNLVIASYMGSGSSAVTDLLREYEKVSCPLGSYEYVFLHCPGGLFDLEDKLLLGNNAIRSDEALRQFRTSMLQLFCNDHWWFGGYRRKLSEAFMDRVDAFLGELTCCSFEGFWYEHEKVSKMRWYVGRVMKKLGLSSCSKIQRLYDDRMTISFPDPDLFYRAASSFVEDVSKMAVGEKSDGYILFDQLFLPHNLNRMNRYYPSGNAKAIVVERDPRDVFVLNKYVWFPSGCPVPFPYSAETFCKYFDGMKKSVPEFDARNVLRVWFEDLVLNYDATVERIESFLGDSLGSHLHAKSFFDPKVSINNVCVYRKDDAFQSEAKLIASLLNSYMYPGDTSGVVHQMGRKCF